MREGRRGIGEMRSVPLWAALCLLLFGAVGARAAPGLLCEGVKADLHAAEPVASALAVFPVKARSKEEDCHTPIERLRFGDADVLVTKRGGPDQNACHGCGARMSAFVLLRTPEGPKPVARFLDFGEVGTYGNPGDLVAIQLDGHDAIGVTGGGTFQGYTSEAISFFVFRDGRLEEIKPFLPLYADNGGALGDDKATTVKGAWHVDPGRRDTVTVDYLVSANSKTRRSSATWKLDGNTFVPVSGRVPDEYKTASGG